MREEIIRGKNGKLVEDEIKCRNLESALRFTMQEMMERVLLLGDIRSSLPEANHK